MHDGIVPLTPHRNDAAQADPKIRRRAGRINQAAHFVKASVGNRAARRTEWHGTDSSHGSAIQDREAHSALGFRRRAAAMAGQVGEARATR